MIAPFLIIAGIIILIIGFIYLVWWAEWADSRRPSRPRLTFKEFESYYNVNY